MGYTLFGADRYLTFHPEPPVCESLALREEIVYGLVKMTQADNYRSIQIWVIHRRWRGFDLQWQRASP